MLHLVKQIIKIEDFTLFLEFQNNEILRVNLEEKIKLWAEEPNSNFKDLLDIDYFQTVQYDKEWESIFWNNDIDLCADVLYKIGKKQASETLEIQLDKEVALWIKELGQDADVIINNLLRSYFLALQKIKK